VTPGFLKVQHPGGNRFRRFFLPFPEMTQRIVLTKNAPQRAPGKKDRPRPIKSAQAILFAVMGKCGGDNGFCSDAAKSGLVFRSSSAALAGTNPAGIHSIPGFLHAFADQPNIKRVGLACHLPFFIESNACQRCVGFDSKRYL